MVKQESVPTLITPDGTMATNSEDRAALLAKLFVQIMQVEYPTYHETRS